MNKKYFAMALTAVLITPAVVSPIQIEAAQKDFKDVSTKNAYYEIIKDMSAKGIINGYEDGTFRPEETISRKHAAALVSRAVKELPESEESKIAPKDLSPKNANYKDLMALYQADLLELDSKDKINPNKALTRGEMSKILAVAFDLEVKAAYDFEDITSKNPYKEYIRAIYSNGVTTGYEDGTFRPNGTLSRKHYAAFMYRAMHLDKNFVADPIKVEDIEISPDMELDDFNKTIKNNPVFDLYENQEVAELVWENKNVRTLLTEGQELLKGTDFKFRKVSPYVTITYPNWVNRYATGFKEAPIGMESYDNYTKFTFDHSYEDVTNLSVELLDLMYPDLKLSSKIKEKAEDGRNALLNGELDYSNIEKVEIDGMTVRYGISAARPIFMVEIQQ
jgi:S-layer homology domain